MAEASRRPNTVLIGEHEYAPARRFSWPGAVVLGRDEQQRVIPGTWRLEWRTAAPVPAGAEAGPMPPLSEAAAWHARVRDVMQLREPGLQLRVGRSDAHGWQSLEVVVPTRPPTVVEFDRDAMARVAGSDVVALRVFASGATGDG